MKNVLIAGGSGLIGSALTGMWAGRNVDVRILTRDETKMVSGARIFLWDINAGKYDPAAFRDVDVLVHLAGENLSKTRWSEKFKKEIIESRLLATRLLVRALKETGAKPRSVLCASAVGYYGSRHEVVDESSAPGSGFLASTTKVWESALSEFSAAGFRTVIFRIGAVLAREGGALQVMAAPFRFFAGAIPGGGTAFVPWIHIDDLCSMMDFALTHEWEGIYNTVAPGMVRSREFYSRLSLAIKRPILLPRIPESMVRLVMGEMAEMALTGAPVSCEKARKTGFVFRHPEPGEAFEDLLRKSGAKK